MKQWFQKFSAGKWILLSFLFIIALLIYSIIIIFPPSYKTTPNVLFINNLFSPLYRIVGKNTVTDAVNKIGPKSRVNLENYYMKAGVNYPGDKVAFLFFEEEEVAEIWAKAEGKWNLIHTYSTISGSNSIILEGVYKITGLNSNLWYPLSMRLQCESFRDPTFDIFLDRKLTSSEGAIMIGDDEFSAGRVSLYDDTFEELYVLAYDVHINNVEFIMSLYDMRKKDREIDDPRSSAVQKSLKKFVK